MTTFAVHDTSCRGCPSMAAGTTLQQLAACSSPYDLTSTIRCRTDRSGFIVDRAHDAHPYDPSATFPATAAFPEPFTQRTPKPSHHAAILSPRPCSGLPIGDKRAFPSPTVSAPNSSQKYNLLQTAGARGAAPMPRPVAGFASSDRTHTPSICVTCQRITTSTRDASTSSRRSRRAANSPVAGRHAPPRQSPFSPCLPTGQPFCRRVCTPTSIAFCRFRPDSTVSTKCSQIASRRRAVYACSSYEITTFSVSSSNSNCCTPPGHGKRPPFRRSLEGIACAVYLAGQG